MLFKIIRSYANTAEQPTKSGKPAGGKRQDFGANNKNKGKGNHQRPEYKGMKEGRTTEVKGVPGQKGGTKKGEGI
jgi:hypothetical protein